MSSFLSSVFLPRILVVEFAKAEAQAFRVLSARSFRPLTAKPRTVIAYKHFCSHPNYFADPPPQRLSSLFSRGHRRFVEGCLLKHLLVM